MNPQDLMSLRIMGEHGWNVTRIVEEEDENGFWRAEKGDNSLMDFTVAELFNKWCGTEEVLTKLFNVKIERIR